MELSTFAWIYLFADRVAEDPRRNWQIRERGQMLGATLHRLALAGDVDLEVRYRRSGFGRWRRQVPMLLVTLKWRDPDRTGFERRLEAALQSKPLRAGRLYRLLGYEAAGNGVDWERDAQDEVIAAGLGQAEFVSRREIAVVWHEERRRSLDGEYEERCGPWLDYCVAHPEVAAALAEEVSEHHRYHDEDF